MTFGAPELLTLLPLAALLLVVDSILRARRRKRLNAMLPPATRARMRRGATPRVDAARTLLVRLALLLIAFALARPQWGYTWRDARREGLDVIVAVDTSNSMRADDFQPSRLQRAKWGVEELVKELKGDRIGLVAFAGEGVFQCPLTLDYGAFLMHLQDLFPGIVPRGGTDLESALTTALEAFEGESESDRVVLLITDGESHEGDLDGVLKRLRDRDVRVFAVGVGTAEGSLIPMDAQGGSFLKNRGEEVVKSTLDEKTLRRVAAETDGLYVRATPRDFGVSEIIKNGLEPLQRAELESARVKEMEERFQLFLGAGLLLLLLEGFARIPGWFRKRRRA